MKLAGATTGLIVANTAAGAAWQDGRSTPGLVPETGPTPGEQTRSGVWTQATAADFSSGQLSAVTLKESPDGLVLDLGARLGSYLSATKRADFPFNAVAATWKANLPLGSNLALEVRTSVDGATWSDWLRFNVVDQYAGYDMNVSDLLLVHGARLQYRATMRRNEAGLSPELNEVTLTYIDSSAGPTLLQAKMAMALVDRGYSYASAEPAPSAGFITAVTRPTILSRAAWGANESYRYSRGAEVWPPNREAWTKIVLHHTATSNETDALVSVRAIYYYHAAVLRWGDIGYNYVVDRNGNIYEGRFGGENVQGGHVYGYNEGSVGIAVLGTYMTVDITPLSERSVSSLLAWLCSRRGINPQGSGFFVDKTLPNVMGHRDAIYTSCPGDRFYAVIPRLRSSTLAQLSGYGQTWISHKVPAYMTPASILRVNVTVRNAGTNTWVTGLANPYRLAYQWYDAAGNKYTREPLERHTDIPRNVALGEEATVNALLFVPSKEGRYTLKWDMVHEGNTWFAEQGNETLDVPVMATRVAYGEVWRGHNTPSTMIPGYTASVTVDLDNAGVKTWNAKGPNPFRLGYHWYDADGSPYFQAPSEDYRGSLPYDVAPGQRVAVSSLVAAPRAPGNYTLKWDMVQEGVTWFAAEPANGTLDVPVRVVALQLPVDPESLEVNVLDKNRFTFRSILVNSPTQQALSWNARVVSGDWLKVHNAWGSAPGTVILIIDPSQLPDGAHLGMVKLTGLMGDTQLYVRNVPVRITVGGAGQAYSVFLPDMEKG
ncbi:MAG: N-acetylmuramoyl-L-alanine amidase [Chloroflexi bacterium]|nr:N-acetylmuramoyl-L-alanine amidase [Chloroflexota bacterium]